MTATAELEPVTLTTNDVAALLRVHRAAVHRNPILRALGYRFGPRTWRWRRSDIERYIAGERGGSSAS